ncbi:uncharacterized protein F4822DRAFT_104270 [Hypoxylon trugodes]|uniref:uncharacterized protein n=1 Tax=Hypoxylon trugodes TaxID=326681 RepID=UPI00218F5554|nr:uncharacterized protein F4822DRAFT_104270 [Hypoxylon trugodes]KAI1382596.1 hypothetical protein F4822DRAFT_104270 [Hypoxylon trugodes]
MAQRVNPSPELVKLLARISQLSLDDATITKVELKSKDGRPAKMQVSRIDWPSEHNAIVEQATQKAVDETKAQIKLLAPQCQEWFANTLLLEEGSLRPKEAWRTRRMEDAAVHT